MSNQNNVLKVTDVSEAQDAKDDRQYKVITVKKPNTGGVIGTSRGHKRVIWSHAPMSGPTTDNPQPNDYFDMIEEGSKIAAEIVTVETEPYFIESENGQYSHPETGKPANRVTQKTYVVFEDETVDSLLRGDDLRRKGAEEEQEGFETANEELVADDLGEEAEEAAVS